MDELKKLFNRVQVDSKSVLFVQDQINDKLLKKLTKSTYKNDKEFVNSFNLLIDKKSNFNEKDDSRYYIPSKAEYVQKSDDIDRSTLYSIQAPFDLLHADVGDLRFLGKYAADPKYCLLLVDLFTSKVYVYGMKNRSLIPPKLEKFYKEVANKRKRLLALQKNRKTKLKSPNILIQKAVENMNSLPTVKYSVEPNKVEENSLESEAYREWYNTRCLHIISKARAPYERYERKKYQKIGEDILLLSSRVKKKNDPKKFYKSSVDNRLFFDKNIIFTITNKQNIDNKTFYWIKNKKTNKKVLFRVMPEEIYTLSGNFLQKKISIKKIVSK